MKVNIPVDDYLWKRFIDGNDGAFSAIYNQYADILYAYGKRYTTDEEEVQDCLQDMFIDLYKYRSSLSPNVNIKFYLLSALRRKITRTLKKASLIDNEIASYEYINSDEFNLTFNAEDILIRNEEQAEYLRPLIKELNLLPSKQKEILFLRFNSNLQYEEIAILLHISVASCRTLVYRAIKQLRKNLENTSSKRLLYLLSIIF